jgi:hypothetical protein
MVSTFLGEVGFGTLSLGIGALQVLLDGDVPQLLTNGPNKNRISVAFAIEWNSGMYSGDPAVFFVLSVIIDEVIE